MKRRLKTCLVHTEWDSLTELFQYQFSPFQQPFEKILDVQNTQPEVCGSLSSANEIAAGLESCDEFQGFGKLSTSFDIKVPVNENQQPFCSYSEDRSRMMENSSRMENEDFSADSFHRGLMDGGFVPSQTGIGEVLLMYMTETKAFQFKRTMFLIPSPQHENHFFPEILLINQRI